MKRVTASDARKNWFRLLLAAHSEARGTPLCTLDRTMRQRHDLVVRELVLPRL